MLLLLLVGLFGLLLLVCLVCFVCCVAVDVLCETDGCCRRDGESGVIQVAPYNGPNERYGYTVLDVRSKPYWISLLSGRGIGRVALRAL